MIEQNPFRPLISAIGALKDRSTKQMQLIQELQRKVAVIPTLEEEVKALRVEVAELKGLDLKENGGL